MAKDNRLDVLIKGYHVKIAMKADIGQRGNKFFDFPLRHLNNVRNALFVGVPVVHPRRVCGEQNIIVEGF